MQPVDWPSRCAALVPAALRALGIRRLLLAIHDVSFPSDASEDVGRGSPGTRAAERFLGFVSRLGFTGVQLGPQGQTSIDNASPYDGTAFSRNVDSLPLRTFADDGELAGLLPEGCSLESAELDTAGDSVVTDVWRRQDLLATFNAMFNGDTGAPAASKLRMNLGENLVAFPDDRPGRSGGIHRAVRSSLDVEVVTGEGNVYRPEGHLLCYVTRGDSAMIPPELVARGVQADSTRWWIDRIEDETTSSHSRPGLHTTPSNVWSFGEVLLFWHHGPPRP